MTYATYFSSSLAKGKRKEREFDRENCVTRGLRGEAGEIYNVFIFSGKKKTNKQTNKRKKKSEIDLCGCGAWNELRPVR